MYYISAEAFGLRACRARLQSSNQIQSTFFFTKLNLESKKREARMLDRMSQQAAGCASWLRKCEYSQDIPAS